MVRTISKGVVSLHQDKKNISANLGEFKKNITSRFNKMEIQVFNSLYKLHLVFFDTEEKEGKTAR